MGKKQFRAFFGIIALIAVIGAISCEITVKVGEGESNPIPLSVGTWYESELSTSSSSVWFEVDVTADVVYYVWVRELWTSTVAAGQGYATVETSAKNKENGSWYYQGGIAGVNSSTDGSVGTSGTVYPPTRFTPGASGKALVRVSAITRGIFKVCVSTSSTRPAGEMGGTVGEKTAASVSAAPTGSVAAGTEITLTATPADAEIWYTTNGNTPTALSETTTNKKYSASNKPVINGDMTLKVFVYVGSSNAAYKNSDVIEFVYTVLVSDPDGTEANPFELDASDPLEYNWLSYTLDTQNETVWFYFNVTPGTVYNVFWDDNWADGSGDCTADVRVSAKYAGSADFDIFGNTDLGVDSGFTAAAIGATGGGQTFTAGAGKTKVLVRVQPEAADISRGTLPGTFDITYTIGAGVKPSYGFPKF